MKESVNKRVTETEMLNEPFQIYVGPTSSFCGRKQLS